MIMAKKPTIPNKFVLISQTSSIISKEGRRAFRYGYNSTIYTHQVSLVPLCTQFPGHPLVQPSLHRGMSYTHFSYLGLSWLWFSAPRNNHVHVQLLVTLILSSLISTSLICLSLFDLL